MIDLRRTWGGRSPFGYVALPRKGLPYEALDTVTRLLGISLEATADWLRLSRRTLSRRKGMKCLDPHESDRVFRLADIGARAIARFGSVQHARTWLLSENRALGGAAPITLLDTDVGARAAEDVLLRIYSSVYS